MLEQLREQIKEKLDKRSEVRGKLDEVLKAPQEESRDLTEEESTSFRTAKEELVELDKEIDGLRDRVNELEELDKRDGEREELAAKIQPQKNENPVVRVGNEPTVYEDPKNSFFSDAFAVNYGTGDIVGASERLERHSQEVRSGAHGAEYRDSVTTGNFSSLVVPQYLPEMFAPNIIASRRVTANLARQEPLLAEGNIFTIPKAISETDVDAQTPENTAVASATFDTTDHVVRVNTYAGQLDVSRQSLDRGRGTDSVIYSDLVKKYSNRLNRAVLRGSGTGNHPGIAGTSGIGSVTATDTTAAGIHKKVGEAFSQVNSNLLEGPNAIIMHPRRWAMLSVGVDSSGRPLVVPAQNVPQNVFGQGDAALVEQRVGQILGVDVYTDPTISITEGDSNDEDRIYVVNRDSLILWENNPVPRQLSFESTLAGQLTVKLVVYEYSAFTAGLRPEGISLISGTGLVTPSFA